jgi:hypothetical protein
MHKKRDLTQTRLNLVNLPSFGRVSSFCSDSFWITKAFPFSPLRWIHQVQYKIVQYINLTNKKRKKIGLYCLRTNKLTVVSIENARVNIPKIGWTFGYFVASQPAVSSARIMGIMERIRAVFKFI